MTKETNVPTDPTQNFEATTQVFATIEYVNGKPSTLVVETVELDFVTRIDANGRYWETDGPVGDEVDPLWDDSLTACYDALSRDDLSELLVVSALDRAECGHGICERVDVDERHYTYRCIDCGYVPAGLLLVEEGITDFIEEHVKVIPVDEPYLVLPIKGEGARETWRCMRHPSRVATHFAYDEGERAAGRFLCEDCSTYPPIVGDRTVEQLLP